MKLTLFWVKAYVHILSFLFLTTIASRPAALARSNGLISKNELHLKPMQYPTFWPSGRQRLSPDVIENQLLPLQAGTKGELQHATRAYNLWMLFRDELRHEEELLAEITAEMTEPRSKLNLLHLDPKIQSWRTNIEKAKQEAYDLSSSIIAQRMLGLHDGIKSGKLGWYYDHHGVTAGYFKEMLARLIQLRRAALASVFVLLPRRQYDLHDIDAFEHLLDRHTGRFAIPESYMENPHLLLWPQVGTEAVDLKLVEGLLKEPPVPPPTTVLQYHPAHGFEYITHSVEVYRPRNKTSRRQQCRNLLIPIGAAVGIGAAAGAAYYWTKDE